MRTTVDIPDPVYRRLKSRAASEGRSAKDIDPAGRGAGPERASAEAGRRIKLPLVPSKEPGTLRLDNAKIYEAISVP